MMNDQNTLSGDGGILVTGGTGFLGSYILKVLVQKGQAVKAIRRNSSKMPSWIDKTVLDKVQWIEGDVLDVVSLSDAMENVHTVIHAAAQVSFTKKERKSLYQVNVEGTANVVNMMLEKNAKRLVHISSVAALGRTAHGGRVNEEKKWEESPVNTHYAISKQKAEMHVWRGMAEGLDAVILNPSTILGYGDWNSSSCAIFKNIHRGISWYPPGVNGFVDVEDVAHVSVLMASNNINNERFIVNGDNWPFREVVVSIARAFGKKIPSKKASPFLLGLAWRLEKLKSLFTGKKPLITRESAKIAGSHTYFLNDKIVKTLPSFSFTPLQQTIEKACDKYLHAV